MVDEMFLDRLRRSLGLVLKDIPPEMVERTGEYTAQAYIGSLFLNTDNCFLDVPLYTVKHRHYDENGPVLYVCDVILDQNEYKIHCIQKEKESIRTLTAYELAERYSEKHPQASYLYHDLERMPLTRISPVRTNCDFIEVSYRSLWLIPDTDIYFCVLENDVHYRHTMKAAEDGSIYDSGAFADYADIDLNLLSYHIRWKNADTFWKNKYLLIPKKYLVLDYLDRMRCGFSGKSDQEFLSEYHLHDSDAQIASCFMRDALV